ncbi:glycosyltransferase [Clostridiaceae bacterium M8S5]|nr:glycosyltransferase [Clostridiaceae bacterium M8S5]
MYEKYRLTVCIISKNSQNNLSNCIENIIDIADEILVIDLENDDNTNEIALKYNAKYINVDYKGDNSKVKNYCLDIARGRWILFLDASEIVTMQKDTIDCLLDNPNVEGYLVYIDYIEQNRINSPIQSMRLIRNRADYRFKYRVFEYIEISNIKDANIRVIKKNDEGDKNNFKILLEELKIYQNNSYLMYIYGIELLNQQRVEESIEYLKKSLESINLEYIYAPHLYKCLAWALISSKRFDEALNILEEGVNEFSFYTDLLVLKAEVERINNNNIGAIKDLEDALRMNASFNIVIPKPEIHTTVILDTLGEIHESLLNYKQAITCYRNSYELNKSNIENLYNIGRVIQKNNSVYILDEMLEESIEQNDMNQMMAIMDICCQQREYSRILKHIKQLQPSLLQEEQVSSVKTVCHMMLGEKEEVKRYFEQANNKSPFYNYMLLQRMEYCWANDDWKKVDEIMDEINNIEDIEKELKEIYMLVNSVILENKIQNIELNEFKYDVINSVMENLLFLNQTDKASILLTLLLQVKRKHKYIDLALPWIKQCNTQAIKQIYTCIQSKSDQKEFLVQIVEQLLRYDYIKESREMVQLGKDYDLGLYEYVLNTKEFMQKLDNWINDVSTNKIIENNKANINKELLLFYRSLEMSAKDDDLTNDKIHVEIGNYYYEELNKTTESLIAYLRAFQLNPLNYEALKKIKKINDNNLTLTVNILKNDFIIEGDYFYSKQSLESYLNGFIYFLDYKFNEAITTMLSVNEDDMRDNLKIAFITSCLWIDNNIEVNDWICKHGKTDEFFIYIFEICKIYALNRIDNGLKEYSFSEIIRDERIRIEKLKLI